MSAEEDVNFLRVASFWALRAPESKSAFSVGALLVDPKQPADDAAFACGFSRETGESDHAEQACLIKFVDSIVTADPSRVPAGVSLPVSSANLHLFLETIKLPKGTVCYSSMEPCGKRASQPHCCAELLVKAGVSAVVYATREPTTFVDAPAGHALLEKAGISTRHVPEAEEFAAEANTHLTSKP